eukprot:scaffold6949_cov107-Cylindrotheca_fusiformis.AAC.2
MGLAGVRYCPGSSQTDGSVHQHWKRRWSFQTSSTRARRAKKRGRNRLSWSDAEQKEISEASSDIRAMEGTC